MDNLAAYIKCQRFIVKSELQLSKSGMGLNLSQSSFVDVTIDCIFDSLEKIAMEIDELKSKK